MGVGQVTVRRLESGDVPSADTLMRTAFGTYLGLADPRSFGGDAEMVATRSRAGHTAAFVAEADGRLLGSSFVTRWGSFGFFGPLTVDPQVWDSGVGGRLMEPVTAALDDWGVGLAGLFTFPGSPKHIGLYHRHGFFPRYLTALMRRAPRVPAGQERAACLRLSAMPDGRRAEALTGAAAVTDALFGGLDLTAEIEEAARQGLGDTVLVEDDAGVAGFAICHLGAGSEAGSGTCYVKFAAIRPGPGAASAFGRLLESCEILAAAAGAGAVVAGVNTAREAAYEAMLEHGYRASMYGLAMHRPNQAGYSRREVFALDDWR
jgi:predicted N-acetyltransferase YhbS